MAKLQKFLFGILIAGLLLALVAATVYFYQFSSGRIPMGEDTQQACDFDGDGDCDDDDKQIFSGYAGKCEPDVGYNPQADDDGSGCVDEVDFKYLFEK